MASCKVRQEAAVAAAGKLLGHFHPTTNFKLENTYTHLDGKS